MSILEYIWITDRECIFRLLGLGLLSGALVEAILGMRLPAVEAPSEYERMMRGRAYKRIRGGALRQVRFE